MSEGGSQPLVLLVLRSFGMPSVVRQVIWWLKKGVCSLSQAFCHLAMCKTSFLNHSSSTLMSPVTMYMDDHLLFSCWCHSPILVAFSCLKLLLLLLQHLWQLCVLVFYLLFECCNFFNISGLHGVHGQDNEFPLPPLILMDSKGVVASFTAVL